jgi:hypothetical protein
VTDKWFTNKAQVVQVTLQVIQTVFAAIACYAAVRMLTQDPLAQQSIGTPSIMILAAAVIFALSLFGAWRGLSRLDRSSRSEAAPTGGVQKNAADLAPTNAPPPAPAEWSGTPKLKTATIKKGEFIEFDDNGKKLTLLGIPKAKGRQTDFGDYVAEVEVAGGGFFQTIFSAQGDRDRFLLPYVSTPSIRDSGGIASDYIRDDSFRYIKIYVEHINTHSKEVTFAIFEAKFRKPYSWR